MQNMAQNDLFEGSYLRQFACPLEEECEHFRNDQPLNCKFRHIYAEDETPKLLPSFVCYQFLMKQSCDKDLRKLDVPNKQGEVENVKADGSGPSSVSKCSNVECRYGIHVSLAELEAGFATNPDNQERINAYCSQFPAIDYQCIVCQDNVRLDRRAPSTMEFAILDNCSHVHCAKCFKSNLVASIQEGRTSFCGIRCKDTLQVLYQMDESKINDPEEKIQRFLREPFIPNLAVTRGRLQTIVRFIRETLNIQVDVDEYMQDLEQMSD